MTDTASVTAMEPVEAEGRSMSAPTSGVIWLLDDDASMLKALGRFLTSAGFTVEKFDDPNNFLANLERAPCRVAILDVWMPDMNGLEVQTCLRRKSPGTRVIFITGRDDPSIRRTAFEAGAFGFLTKPFEDDVLIDLIEKAVTTRQAKGDCAKSELRIQ